MASNEHKNLSEANLHNPKDFSTATNDTLCSKDAAAALEWVEKRFIKVVKKTFAGFATIIANYQYSEAQNYGQSPYELNQDYGSATISAATTVNQKNFFRIGTVVEEQGGEIQKCQIQVTSPDAETFKVALVKYTPSGAVTTSYPTVLFEKEVVGVSNNNLVNNYILDVGVDFTNTAVAAKDHIFLMVKGTGVIAAQVVYINVTIEMGYTN